MDGFAKLHSFKFDGTNVYYSGKMIESTTYMDSVAKGELVPQVTLNKLADPNDEWTAMEISVRPIYRSNRLIGQLIGIDRLIGSANQTNPNIGSVSDRPIIRACIG